MRPSRGGKIVFLIFDHTGRKAEPGRGRRTRFREEKGERKRSDREHLPHDEESELPLQVRAVARGTQTGWMQRKRGKERRASDPDLSQKRSDHI